MKSAIGSAFTAAEPPANTLGVDFGGVATVPFHSHLIPTDTFTPAVAAGDFTYRMVVYMPSDQNEEGYWCMFWPGENRDGVGFTKTDGTFGGGTLQDSGDPKYVSVPGILDNWHEFRFVYTQEGRRLTVLMDGSEIRSAGDINTANFACIFGDNDTDDNPLYIASLELFDTADADEIPPCGARCGVVDSPCPVTGADGGTVATGETFLLTDAESVALTAPASATLEDSPRQKTVKLFQNWRVVDAATGAVLQTAAAPALVFDLRDCTAQNLLFEAVYETVVQPKPGLYARHCLGKWDFDKADDLLLATYGQDLVAGGSGTVSALADPPENTLGGTELGGVARIPPWTHLTVSDTLTGDVMEGDFTFRILAYLDTTLGETSYHSFFWDGENDGTVFVYKGSSIGGPYYGGSSNYTQVPGIADAWHDFRFAYHADTGKMDFYMDGVRYKTAAINPAQLPHLFGDDSGEDNTAYVAAIELFDTADQDELPLYLTTRQLRNLDATLIEVR